MGGQHLSCGEGGIRTHGTIASTRTFQARSFGHSDTSPIIGPIYCFYLLSITFWAYTPLILYRFLSKTNTH